MKKINFYYFLLSVLIITSCNEEPVYVDDASKDQINLNIDNKELQDFAKIFAKSMQGESGRLFIKQKAIEKFDNDYDILLAKLLNDEMEATVSNIQNYQDKTFRSYLKSTKFNDRNSKLKSSENFDKLLNYLINKYPLLQVSIPEIYENSTDDWDAKKDIPLIAVLPENYDENITQFIPAYDVNGDIHFLEVNTLPEKPVIVLGLNERLLAFRKDEFANKRLNPKDDCLEYYYSTENYDYYLPSDCGGGIVGGGNDNSSGTDNYDRDKNNETDKLNKAKFVDKTAYRQVEAWPQGRPEFKVIITYIEKVGNNYETKTITKILTKSGWVERYVFWVNLKTKQIDIPIITWDKSIIGSSMKYTWIEQDNSDTKTELTTSVSTKYGDDIQTTITGTAKITISAKDDEAGEAIVEYKDKTAGEGTEYNTGIVKFWINQ